jgi:hypothetical protein
MTFNIPWQLFQKLVNNSLSPEEDRELRYWRDSSELNKNIYDEISADEQFKIALTSNHWNDNSAQWNNIISRIQQPAKRLSFSRRRFFIMSAAAANLFLFSV